MPANQNPGNFANRPQEEVESIARKGGQSSHQGGFASMDPRKQVRLHNGLCTLTSPTDVFTERHRFQGWPRLQR